MTKEEQLIHYIESKTDSLKINERAKSKIATLLIDYSLDFLKECVEISFSRYIKYDQNGKIELNSFNDFFNKIGGIAYNRSLTPIDREIAHILNVGDNAYSYWDNNTAKAILKKYIIELQRNNWTNDKILNDLKNEVLPLFNTANNWSRWRAIMEDWIDDIASWKNEENSTQIESHSSIIPNELIESVQRNIKQLCYQINASFENNLYDCCAVIMRRLLEILLIESFVKNGFEDKIKLENGHYINLDKIIEKVESTGLLRISATTKKDLSTVKDIGNFSAHKIWYNCTKTDIDNIKQKYRLMIEELLYLSGLIH